jgi:cell division septation protein DedD
MSDGSFREIQLTAKQVVFLFMAGLVAAVGIFLLGVRVGQRVSPDAPSSEAANTAESDNGAPTVMPPATTPRPGELTAPNDLQDRPAPAVTATPAPELPVITPAAKPTPPPPSASPATPAKTPEAKPALAGSHYVQIDSFSSRANADRQASQLKARGHAAEVAVGPASERARYKVRIGPLPEQAARDLQARLRKEGLRPSLVPR